MVAIKACTHNEFELFVGHSRREAGVVRRDVVRNDDRTKESATTEIPVGIKFFRLPEIGIAAQLELRLRVAVGTSRLRVDEVTSQADERAVPTAQIQFNRRNLESPLDLALFRPIITIMFAGLRVTSLDKRDSDGDRAAGQENAPTATAT